MTAWGTAIEFHVLGARLQASLTVMKHIDHLSNPTRLFYHVLAVDRSPTTSRGLEIPRLSALREVSLG